MARIPILDVADHGVNYDMPPHLLPPGAWSFVLNMRCAPGGMRKVQGYSNVRAPSFAPYAIFYVLKSDGSPLWAYCGTTDVRAFSGSTDAEITRLSGDYTGTSMDEWNGGVYNGLLVLNNGVDVPQVWSTPATGTKLIDLPNWTSTWRAKVIRPFKAFLVALDITKSGARTSRMVKWSHTADTSYPSSWDETDATKDAGENILRDGQGPLIDCLPLGDENILYTDRERWSMGLSGTGSIFNFFRLSETSGLLGQGCAAQFRKEGVPYHFAVTRDDIIIHNGSSETSVADSRVRDYFFSQLDLRYAQFTKVVPFRRREMLICFPVANGSGYLTKALIWNWVNNTWAFRELPSVRGVTTSPIPVSLTADLWSSDTVPWDGEAQQTWAGTEDLRLEDSILFGQINTPTIHALTASTLNGSGMSLGQLIREGLCVVPVEGGPPVSDLRSIKLLTAIWPHVELSGVSSVTLKVQVGYRDKETGAYTYLPTQNFQVGIDEKLDIANGGIKGRFFSIQFTDNQQVPADWRFMGYEVDVEVISGR